MCSAISSTRTSSLVRIFFSSRAMRSRSGWRLLRFLVWKAAAPFSKELFLPTIENRRLKYQLVAELRDRLVVNQMPPQKRRPSLRLCSAFVAFSCVLSVSLTAERFSPVPAEAGHRQLAPRRLGEFPPPSNDDPLDFIKRDLIGCPVVELGGPWRFVRGDHLRALNASAIEQIGRNPGRPEDRLDD